VVARLAGTARLRDVVVDTSHFLGNARRRCRSAVRRSTRLSTVHSTARRGRHWWLAARCCPTPRTGSGSDAPEVTHLRVDIYPDGGFARLRANGELTAAGYDATLRRWLDTLPPAHLWQVLTNAGLDAALVAAALRERERPLGWASEVPAAFTPR
jgi:allantoicase